MASDPPLDRAPRRLEHEHTLEAIRTRLARRAPHSYLRDFVYGGIDGAVTTFAVVSGVAGAELGTRVVLILSVANLIADGFSMAASNYSGTRAEHPTPSSPPGHHGPNSWARLGPVKALASLDPQQRAAGLDRALGRAPKPAFT